MGKPPECFKTLHEKRLYRQLMQILNDSTHPMRHYFDSRCSNKSGSFLLPITYTNHYKASFYPRLCQFLTTVIAVINCVCACVILSAEDDNFPRGAGRGGGGGGGGTYFYLSFWFWFVREYIIPGKFGFAGY